LLRSAKTKYCRNTRLPISRNTCKRLSIPKEARPRIRTGRADGYPIAEAVLIPIYGPRQIDDETPFNATLDGDVWTVSGSLHCKTTAKVICVGGTAVVQLSKTTGEILLLIHEA
jgi:hypothetical protein